MIIYDDSCEHFINDCLGHTGESIGEKVRERMIIAGSGPSISELRSWNASLPALALAIRGEDLPKDAEIGIEYSIRGNRHRIDAIICGTDENDDECAVIIELKQWSSAYRTDKQYFVHTVGGGGEDDYWHPSYQAANYAGILENFYAYVQDRPVRMRSCSYLHNMPTANFEILGDTLLYPAVESSPVFLKGDEVGLRSFIGRFIKNPCKDMLFRIDHSEIRPSPKLSDMLRSAIDGNAFFSYSDEQADAVSSIVQAVRKSCKYGGKKTIIIKGRPGTGKSIVAINALGQLIAPLDKKDKGRFAAYFTCNSAPRTLFSKKLTDDNYKMNMIKALFRHPLALRGMPENSIACAIFDEAHRMYDWKGGTGMRKDENLIVKCIHASLVAVFFLDEDQAVTIHDYLTLDRLKMIAEECGSEPIEGPVLKTQFRVFGGDGYLTFIRSILGYDTDCICLGFEDYDVRIFDRASDMREALREMNERYKDCRMVAGYTYEWVTKDDYEKGYDIELDNGEFKARWNMSKADYSWLYDSGSFEDVGCIHTCQGLDMQYCGVIIGKDLRYENGKLVFDQNRIAKSDHSSGIRTCKDRDKAARLIRNTYNVLLSRGMRGTFIYCEDEGLREHLKGQLSKYASNK